MGDDVITGSDGKPRCAWAATGDAQSIRYHDQVWGTRTYDEPALFEALTLGVFEAGLSWSIVFGKREAFRRAFHAFDVAQVAAMTERDVDRLVQDPSIIRNRAKIQATLDNARAMTSASPSLASLARSYERSRKRAPRSLADLPTSTPQADAFAKQLKSQGYRFVGPTSVYAFMQNVGVVNDHIHGCFRATDYIEPPTRARGLKKESFVSESGVTQMITRQRKADGLMVRYADSERRGGETVLLLNPWPESLFAWETIWSRLAENARLVAIDLPGFGQSEGRADLLSPRAMGTFLLRLIDEWGLGHPHVVGPDVGTGAVLFAASEDVERLPSAVVGSGGASFPLEVTGTLKEIIEAPDLSGFRAVDGRDIVAGALGGIERHTLSEAAREDYLTSYAGDRFGESAAYVRSYPHDLPILAERLADIRTPVQIIAGRHDPLVPPSNAEFLHARLADSKLDILETGHYTWEDGADEYLELTRSWIEAHSAAGTSA